ncbi:MAG: hypothetical protein MJ229_00490 [bacterium]|nr:hypothetical protein [bacterium]
MITKLLKSDCSIGILILLSLIGLNLPLLSLVFGMLFILYLFTSISI